MPLPTISTSRQNAKSCAIDQALGEEIESEKKKREGSKRHIKKEKEKRIREGSSGFVKASGKDTKRRHRKGKEKGRIWSGTRSI